MKLLILALVFCGASFAQITGGTSGTSDGGLVAFVAWAGTYSGACVPGALGSYSSLTYSVLQSLARRCMALEYNAADGNTNTNDTIIAPRQGGGLAPFGNGAQDWSGGFAFPNNTVKRWDWFMIDGSAGKHFNIIFPQYTVATYANVSGGTLNSSATSFTVAPTTAITTAYWPQSTPFVLVFATGEQIEVTGQTGSFASTYSVTASTRGFNGTTPTSHTVGENAWTTDTSGVGNWDPASQCDMVTLLSYLASHMGNGSVPGRKDRIWLAGWSNGARLAQDVNQYGHALLAAGGCNSEWTDNSWVIQGAWLNSAQPDWGATTDVTTMSSSPSPYTATSNGLFPAAGVAVTGPDANAPASYSSISFATYQITGLSVTSPNSAYVRAQRYSAQFCQPGYFTPCALTPDPNPGREYLNLGQADNIVGGVAQHNFGVSTTIPIVLTEQSSILQSGSGFHEANFDFGTNCTGIGVPCMTGAVMQAATRFFSNGGQGSTSGGSSAAGASGGVF